ncbi:putative bifunctional diguanylate cyclase/phosphodiesterase [Sphingomonas sp. RB1R13]|uniref:putative bifunctional diguanylate cyclase/phosphodiesterase n=1 Tax=Sphingomonas sp. RB1R13 TaxID=3096159 RepID=UPI002FCA3ADF
MSYKIPSSRWVQSNSVASARRDLVVLGILIGAIILLIWNGSLFFRELQFTGADAAGGVKVATTALCLNVALILFGWRRYVDLHHESEKRAESDARALAMATTDAMTGLLNRKGFADQGARLAERADAEGLSLAMISIQLDRFKLINDRHGFDVGDELLRRLATAILSLVDREVAVARLSGDELAVSLIRPATETASVHSLSEILLRTITQPYQIDGKHIQVGAYIGIATADGRSVAVADLLRRADIALDQARSSRSARPLLFDAGMESALIAHSEIEQGIRFALEHEQFEPYFEPQIDLATGTLVGFEALARWNHRLSGLIMPDQFIPVAEEIGLIGRLSEQVMRAAFRAAVEWHPSVKLSVNVSPKMLSDAWLAQKIVRMLNETGLPANRLVIEITESSLFADIDQARTIVDSLKNQGIQIALDDFGTGFSSLSYLRTLPFDVIKIDRSFIATIHRDRQSAAIVRAVTTLATALDVPVTVEGIEDAATLESVVAMGCAVGQGWYFGKPMTADQAGTMVRASLVGGTVSAACDVIQPITRAL